MVCGEHCVRNYKGLDVGYVFVIDQICTVDVSNKDFKKKKKKASLLQVTIDTLNVLS